MVGLPTMKDRVRQIARRTGGRSLPKVIEELQRYLGGVEKLLPAPAIAVAIPRTGRVDSASTAHAATQALEERSDGQEGTARSGFDRGRGRPSGREPKELVAQLCLPAEQGPAAQVVRRPGAAEASDVTSTLRTAGCEPARPAISSLASFYRMSDSMDCAGFGLGRVVLLLFCASRAKETKKNEIHAPLVEPPLARLQLQPVSVVPSQVPTKSGGQVTLVPSQLSATSHTLCAERHTVEAGFLASTGQAGFVPSQVSSRSQAPPALLQTVAVLVFTKSGGQVTLVPSQLSATSHTLCAERHTVEVGFLASTGQAGLVPLQVSSRSQAPAEMRQTVPGAWSTSAGQLLVTPSQVSAASQIPVAFRHTTVFAFLASAGQVGCVPLQFSARSQTPPALLQTVLAEAVPQVPSTAAPAVLLQAWQSAVTPPPHALLQQTPSAQ